MPKIFISYRRADSQAITDRLHDHLVSYFEEGSLFQDVDNMPFGVDFPDYLSAEINQCDVVLVVMGQEWERMIQERAAQPDDFVRIEVESALRLNKRVIPVLVNEASMPDPNHLPESIRDLCRKNAARVRPNPDFRRDCQRLAEGIKQVFQNPSVQAESPRQPASIQPFIPAPFQWIEIPGGSGILVMNQSSMPVPAQSYWMAKYPVTNGQFRQFIQSGGYTTQRWWTKAGWSKLIENGWTAARHTYSADSMNHPVVGISWYEAVAFCLWLSEQSGRHIMLPTESQWQYAAQGTDNRNYPWGNQWDCTRCNNSVTPCNSYGTSPVNQYEGNSPFDVSDMAGNVWEWCLTDGNERNFDLNAAFTYRVLHGGSWDYSYADPFRCDSRLRVYAHESSPLRGFRIAGTD